MIERLVTPTDTFNRKRRNLDGGAGKTEKTSVMERRGPSQEAAAGVMVQDS